MFTRLSVVDEASRLVVGRGRRTPPPSSGQRSPRRDSSTPPYKTALASALLLFASTAFATDRPPNVILINCDDLGYGDLACYGAKDIRTPHLDRMAREGTRFTDFSVAAPLCTPSRAALMTGKYPGRTGRAIGVLRPKSTQGLAGSEVTLAEIVKPRGYATGCIGKWHLGFLPGMRPLDQGFDTYYGVLHNLDTPETAPFEAEGGIPILRGDQVEKRPAIPAEMTGLYTAEALAFIERNRDRPFFLYLAHAMPHLPFDASPAFKGKSPRGLYGDVVAELDDSTGRILERLRALGLAEQTLVIFTSDNGPERNTTGTAAPLRGTKHTVYEGGLRVPFIAWWPGRVPAGRVCDEFVTTLEILPTLAALAGNRTLPAGLDGFDLSPVLLGAPGARSPRTTLYSLYGYRANRRESFREGRWKLHVATPPELYDLTADPAESTNVAAQHPDLVARLTAAARQLRESTGIPATNPADPFDPPPAKAKKNAAKKSAP
ncbi:MAG: sulfatase [Verrucomicrobia bacterium]|nr:sulfatase [Verrucomicrobiota bacterium]